MFSKKFLVAQVFILFAVILLLIFYPRQAPNDLDILGKVKDFQLINSNELPFSLKNLKGKVWVADFFFTSCGSICPMMSAHMNRLYQIFKAYKDVQLVSFTVNPENDSPTVLKKYAQKFNADTSRWVFLTGSREEITNVVVNSFKIGDIKEPIFHSSYFVLIDRQGEIRGYYDSTNPKNIDKIIKDIKKILKTE
jgi:protein SCO1/2